MSLDPALLQRLREALGAGELLTEPADCWAYGYDNSRHHSLPQAVAFPVEHEQVRALVAVCHEARLPVVARGRGTATTGAAVPLRHGLVISLERMNRIVRIDPDNRLAVVEPGVTNQALQQAAGALGFFWPPDPTSAAFCSIGGNLACNSAGPRAVKYGTPRDNILGLRAVTGDGQTLRTGVYTTKGVVGYDLTRLIVGSEGSLAVITEATLKLTPRPEAVRTLRAVYADMSAAARAVARIMAQPVTPCALEFMDATAIALVRGYAAADIPADAGGLLMIEVDGPADYLDLAAAAVGAAARGEGLLSLDVADSEAAVTRLWQARKSLSPSLRKAAPKKINEDVVVPVSRIPALIDGLRAISERHGIAIVNFGHAGNGNIHMNLLYDPADARQAAAAPACLDEAFDLVLSLEGTLSGEHGVGIDKREFVAREIEPVTLELMRRIKSQFDPHGILNPDKGWPARANEAPDALPERRL